MKKTWVVSGAALAFALSFAVGCSSGKKACQADGDCGDEEVCTADGTCEHGGDHHGADAGADAGPGGNGDAGSDAGVPDLETDAGTRTDCDGGCLSRSSSSRAIDISENDATIAAVNPDDDTVTFVGTSANTVSGRVTIAGAMPVSVVIHPNGTTAYVVGRKTQRLYRINAINTNAPTLDVTSAVVGSEPTGVALSPTGATAVVTNYGENTVSIVNTTTMTETVRRVVNANPDAHPRAVAITNDLDLVDTDESAYVTLFFGQPATGATNGQMQDNGLTGKVVEITLSNNQVANTINLAPVNTGLTVTGTVGTPSITCSPNQLFGITINVTASGSRGYVPNLCVAPQGPTNPLSNVYSVVSVFDLSTKAEDTSPSGTTVLTRLVQASGNSTAALLGSPVDLSFIPGGAAAAYLVAQSSDTMQRIGFASSGTFLGRSTSEFVQTQLAGPAGPKGPLGIILNHRAPLVAYVNNWLSKSLSVIPLSANPQVDSTQVQLETLPTTGPMLQVFKGRRFFFTGTGRWSLRGVSSCGSCHPDGLSDNVTWQFAAGPRQTTPLEGSFGPTGQRVFNWTGIFDEVHDFENNTRGISGGKGAIVQDGGAGVPDVAISLSAGISIDGGAAPTRNDSLSGSARHVTQNLSLLQDWDEIEEYLRTIPANRAPTGLVQADVAAGAVLYLNACTNCHGGDNWTVSRLSFTPSQDKNGTDAFNPDAGPLTGLRLQTLDGGTNPRNTETFKVASEVTQDAGIVGPERITCVIREVGTFGTGVAELKGNAGATTAQGRKGYNPPSLLGMATSAPYFHNGVAATLEDVFSAGYDRHYTAQDPNFLINGLTRADDVRRIAAFLRSIDDSTTPIPQPAGQDICLGY